LTLDGKLEAAFQDVGRFNPRMRVPADRNTRLYCRFHTQRFITRCRTSVCDKIFRVTPPAAGGAPWADASVATKPVIAHSAHDAKPRLVSMANLPAVSGSQSSGLPQRNTTPAPIGLTRRAPKRFVLIAATTAQRSDFG
jgi:hypothetical protein